MIAPFLIELLVLGANILTAVFLTCITLVKLGLLSRYIRSLEIVKGEACSWAVFHKRVG